MKNKFRECLWRNFAATIDMLKIVIEICPNTIWEKKDRFFYMAYHTVIFLDYYLSYPVKEFKPELPFTIILESEIPLVAIDDVSPNRHYSKTEILTYINLARKKCEGLIGPNAKQDLTVNWINKSEIGLYGLCPSIVEDYSLLEILFYNLRHVQHHVGQLNYILRDKADMAAEWISQTD